MRHDISSYIPLIRPRAAAAAADTDPPNEADRACTPLSHLSRLVSRSSGVRATHGCVYVVIGPPFAESGNTWVVPRFDEAASHRMSLENVRCWIRARVIPRSSL
jgi:hypothetical protein